VLTIAAAIAMLALPRLSNLGGFSNSWDYDEGVHLAMARLMVQGKSLFDPIFCGQAPLQTEAIAMAFRIFGDSVASARLINLLFGCLGLLAAARIAWHIGGDVAAGLAGICLSAAYLYARQSWYCEPAVQATALATISIAAALESSDRRWIAWSVVSGLAMAAAVMSKQLVVPMVPVAAAAFLLRQNDGDWTLQVDRRRLLTIGLFTVALVAGIAAVAMCYPIRELYRQLVQFHLDKAVNTTDPSPLDMIAQYTLRDLGIAALATAGWAIGLSKRSTRIVSLWLALWMACGLAFLLRHQPLWAHHLILLVIPLCIAAGIGGAWLASRRGFVVILVMLLPLITIDRVGPRLPLRGEFGLTFAPLRNYVRFIDCAPSADETAAMAVIAENTDATDLVATDEQKLAYWAGRASPPNMCDTSDPRVISGYLSLDEVIASSQQAKLVLLWRGCLEQIPGYREWLVSNGWRAIPVAGSRMAYLNPNQPTQ
jgi:hypothetical protein